jgi:hypothetical protein
MSQTSNIVIECQLINYLNLMRFILFKKWLYCCMQLMCTLYFLWRCVLQGGMFETCYIEVHELMIVELYNTLTATLMLPLSLS